MQASDGSKSYAKIPVRLPTADRYAREQAQQRQRMQQRLAQENEANGEHSRLLDGKSYEQIEPAYLADEIASQDSFARNFEVSEESLGAHDQQSFAKTRIHFFDLPQEVRDMIYARFPGLASIHINQDPSKGALQPSLSQVSRQMRKESLDVFYGKNNFFLDLRGWKGSSYPRKWTPKTIFEQWITAIGSENAARLRSLKFYSHNFSVNVRISNEKPPAVVLKFRTFLSKAEVAEGLPSSYTFAIAAQRAEGGLRRLLEDIQRKTTQRGLSVDDFKTVYWAVDRIQPFLCRRISLGYQGAVLLEDDTPISHWPRISNHIDKCDDWYVEISTNILIVSFKSRGCS